MIGNSKCKEILTTHKETTNTSMSFRREGLISELHYFHIKGRWLKRGAGVNEPRLFSLSVLPSIEADRNEDYRAQTSTAVLKRRIFHTDFLFLHKPEEP